MQFASSIEETVVLDRLQAAGVNPVECLHRRRTSYGDSCPGRCVYSSRTSLSTHALVARKQMERGLVLDWSRMTHRVKKTIRAVQRKCDAYGNARLLLLFLAGYCLGGEYPPASASDARNGGFIILFLCGAVILSLYLRHRARQCPTCHTKMLRLKKGDQDACLDENQRKEKSLRSVRFDVWQCRKCGFSRVKGHRSHFTSYKKCKKCRRRTMSIEYRVVESATANSEGKGVARRYCWNCLYESEDTYSIPRKES
jgi:hypothetical protein